MKSLILIFALSTANISLAADLQDGKYKCDDESILELKQLKAKFHDISKDEKEINGLSILNSGKAIQLKFDNGTSILCHRNKTGILFL